MTKQNTLLHARLVQLLGYERSTGEFTYLLPRGYRRLVGQKAGGIDQGGYRVIVIDDVKFKAHRLAWFYVHQTWPTGQVDHINGDKLDNRLGNLRLASPQMNKENQRVASRNSSTQLLGAHKARNTSSRVWRSGIKVHGKVIHLGYFESPEDAHAAYVEAKRRLHEGCTI